MHLDKTGCAELLGLECDAFAQYEVYERLIARFYDYHHRSDLPTSPNQEMVRQYKQSFPNQ